MHHLLGLYYPRPISNQKERIAGMHPQGGDEAWYTPALVCVFWKGGGTVAGIGRGNDEQGD